MWTVALRRCRCSVRLAHEENFVKFFFLFSNDSRIVHERNRKKKDLDGFFFFSVTIGLYRSAKRSTLPTIYATRFFFFLRCSTVVRLSFIRFSVGLSLRKICVFKCRMNRDRTKSERFTVSPGIRPEPQSGASCYVCVIRKITPDFGRFVPKP